MAPSDADSRRPLLPRIWQHAFGRVLLCILGLGVSTYLSVMTLSVVLLNGGGIGWLVAFNTDDARVQIGRAYSPWPGRVVFRDLHLEIHDSASHFDLRVARGEVDVDLAALLERRFEGENLQAQGARVQIRFAQAYQSAEREARLPRLSAPKPPNGETRAEDLWGVAVGIDSVTFDEAWIDDARVPGSIVVRGGFDLQPLRYLVVSDSQVEFNQCELWLGKSQVTRNLEGTLQVQLPRTEVDTQAGKRLSKHADVTTKLAARVTDVAPLGLYLGEDWSLFGGEGTLSVDARLRNQELSEGSHLNYQSPVLGVRHRSVSASGASMLTLSRREHAHGRWTFRDVDLRRGERGARFGHATSVRLDVEAVGPLTELGVSSAELDLKHASTPDLSKLPFALPSGIERLSGAAKGDLNLRYAGGQVRGETSLKASELSVEGEELGLKSDVWLSASARARAPFREVDLSRLSLDLRGARVAAGRKGHSKPFRIALDTTRYRFNWKTLEAGGPLELELSDSEPLQRVAGADVPGVAESLFGI
ncbi:MAG: hypothetical protein KC492_21240, partial [Myxococcales bacterium]|nr:hypothetical protein [Myxococcales bacterium]